MAVAMALLEECGSKCREGLGNEPYVGVNVNVCACEYVYVLCSCECVRLMLISA